MSEILKDFDKKTEIPKAKLDFPKIDLSGIDLAINNMNTIFDDIAKDIREERDNAMAMEFTKCVGELLKNNGVAPKITEYTRNFEADRKFETRYGVSIEELDFAEHDKVFEDKIAELENIINHRLGDWDKHGITYQEILDMKSENQELKQRIAELESELEKKECIKTMRIEFYADNEEMLTPLEVANSLINQNTFKVDELRELAEHLQVYCRHHNDKKKDAISF